MTTTPAGLQSHLGPVTELLQKLEAERASATVHVQTSIGAGEISVFEGRIVDAFIGETFGRAALLSVLGLSDAKSEVKDEPSSERRPPIVASVAEAIEEKNRRINEWQALSKRAPSLSSIPTLTGRGSEVLADPRTDVRRGRVLALVDGRRSLTEVIDESGQDAVVALRWLVEAFEAGMARERPRSGPRSSAPLQPVVEPTEPKAVVQATAVPSERTTLGNQKRRKTEMGLGLPRVVTAPSEPPKTDPPPRETPKPDASGGRAEIRRVISITGAPVGKPEPVQPRRVTGDVGVRSERGATAQSLTTTDPVGSPPPINTQPPAGAQPPVGAQPLGAVEPPPASNFIGRYEVLFKIGQGGMGTVHLGRITSGGGFRRLFAIKLLRSHLAQDGSAARKFLDEARMAASIHHPNVVAVVDAGFHGSQPFLVMDYVEGGSLKDLLSVRPAEGAPAMLLPIFLEALSGLHAAHSLLADDGRPLHLVHCDVSPENILVGVDGVSRLTDFGVARHADVPRQRGEMTHGKPAYLAPEQILGGRVDRRTDLFAMGTVIYNALTGIKLFEGSSIEHTFDNVCRMPIHPPSTVGHRPPPSLDFVCMKALERDPDRRFSSAEEMMAEFRRIAMREDLLAPVGSIARWVQTAVGPELARRRSGLVASGRTSVPPPGAEAPQFNLNAPPPAALFATESESGPDGPEPGDTLSLGKTQQRWQRWALVAASVLALVAVFATLLWPKQVSKLFRLKTEGVVSDSVRVPADQVPPRASGVPVSRPPAPAEGTP